MAAVLLGPKDPVFAKKALATARSLHDYATLYPVRLKILLPVHVVRTNRAWRRISHIQLSALPSCITETVACAS